MDKLGKRLAKSESISDDDYHLLALVADAYQAVLDQVEVKLRELGYSATTRVKTTGTLVDKLRRPGAPPLKDVHDLAGARIVVDGGHLEQDAAGNRIRDAFADCPKSPLEVDRRKNPSFGYRALHIIVFPEKIPVEIQIRTRMQDSWAQIVEKLGDSWGRGIRYGEAPDDRDAVADGFAAGLTRAQAMDGLMEIADRMDVFESAVKEEEELSNLMLLFDPEERGEGFEERSAVSAADYRAASAALDEALRRLSGSAVTRGGAE